MGALSNFQVRWAYKQNRKTKKRNEENEQTNIVAEIKAVVDIAGANSRADMCVFQ